VAYKRRIPEFAIFPVDAQKRVPPARTNYPHSVKNAMFVETDFHSPKNDRKNPEKNLLPRSKIILS